MFICRGGKRERGKKEIRGKKEEGEGRREKGDEKREEMRKKREAAKSSKCNGVEKGMDRWMEEGGMAGGMMTISRGNVVSRGGKLCDSDVLLMLGVELGHERILDAAQDHGPAAPIKELFALADRNEGI